MPVGRFEEVLAAARSGAEWAFSALYRDLNPPLLRYFASRVPADAEDLAAETWMGAADRIGSFSGGEQDFRRWLFTIAHHRMVQYWRSASRRRDHCVPDAELLDHADPASPSEEVVASISAVSAAARIASLLTPEQAEIVLLRVLGGLTVDEVAEVVGKRPGAVRVAQHRALKKLADENFTLEVTR